MRKIVKEMEFEDMMKKNIDSVEDGGRLREMMERHFEFVVPPRWPQLLNTCSHMFTFAQATHTCSYVRKFLMWRLSQRIWSRCPRLKI